MRNPLTFIQEVRQEVSKVTWPTWKEVWITTIMVLIMVSLTAIFFLIADQIIAAVVKYILQAGQALMRHDRVPDACAVLRQGVEAARKAGDTHAQGEMQGLLDSIE